MQVDSVDLPDGAQLPIKDGFFQCMSLAQSRNAPLLATELANVCPSRELTADLLLLAQGALNHPAPLAAVHPTALLFLPLTLTPLKLDACLAKLFIEAHLALFGRHIPSTAHLVRAPLAFYSCAPIAGARGLTCCCVMLTWRCFCHLF